MNLRRINRCSVTCQIAATAGMALVLALVTFAYVHAMRPSMDATFARFTVSRMGQTATRLDIGQGVHRNAVTVSWIDLDANLFLGSTSASRAPDAARFIGQLRRCYRASLDVWQESLGSREPVPVDSVTGLSDVIAADPQLQALVVQTPAGPALRNADDRAVLRMWQYADEQMRLSTPHGQ